MASSQPNVVFVLADQHHASLMGCAGHEQVMTPNLDAFASSGMRFSNAYCQNPICTPSRMSFFSGQYVHNHGYYGLSGPTPFGLDSVTRHFHDAGYRTGAWGKLHYPEHPRLWMSDDLDCCAHAYQTADGDRARGPFLRYLEGAGLRHLEDSWHNTEEYGERRICHDARPSKLPYEHTMERWCVREALKFIDEEPEDPFFVHVALQRPHHPLLPNPQFWEMYPADVELPPTINHEPAGRPPHFRRMWENFHNSTGDYGSEDDTFEDLARRVWRGTLACISQIDDCFGRLMEGLEERGLAGDTIVVYGSDHGAYHSIHGIAEKAPGICSDAVCRIPMIWRVPGVTEAGSGCEEFLEGVDLGPTLMSLCEMQEMEAADGLDATPLLRGEDEPLKDTAVTENAWSKSIRWGPWRMVHYQREMFDGEDVGELYNIEEDPWERRNLYHDPEHRNLVVEGRRRLTEWLIRTTRVATSQPTVWSSGERLRGKRTYPVCSDGTAPNAAQPKGRDKGRMLNYL